MSKNAIKLKLQNFRRFVNTGEVIFQPGLTIISGPNGAGKTTLIESLMYALFGPSTKHGKNLLDIRSDNAIGNTIVECELMIDQQLVKIVRKGKLAELWINNASVVQDIPSSMRIANKHIQQMLGGLTREQFERIYVALQGDTAGLVEEDRKTRYDIIERVLQLDVLRQALELQDSHRSETIGIIQGQGATVCHDLQLDENARTLLMQFKNARKLQNRLEHAQKFLKAMNRAIDKQKIEVEAAQQQLKETSTYVATLAERAKDQSTAIEAQKKRCQDFDRLQTHYQNFATQIAQQDGQYTAVQTEIKKLEETLKIAEQYAEVAQEYEQLSASIGKKEQRLQRLPHIHTCYQALERAKKGFLEQEQRLDTFAKVEEELLQAQHRENEAKRQREALLQEDPLYEAELHTWRQQDTLLQQMETQNREALELLQTNSDEARCPTCNQHFTEHTPEQRIQHLQRWLDNELPGQRAQLADQKKQLDQRTAQRKQDQQTADQKYLESQKLLEVCRGMLAQRDLSREHYTTMQKGLAQAQSDWDDLEETVEYDPLEGIMLKKVLENLQERADILSKNAALYNQMPQLEQTLDEKQSTLKKYAENREKLWQHQAELGYQSEIHQAARETLETMQTDLGNTKQEQITAQATFEQARASVQQAKQTFAWAIDHYDRFETSVQEFYKEDRLYTLLDEFKKHFFEANTKEVFLRTTQLLQHAITDQSILGIQFDGQNLSYLDASGATRPVSRLSGGEKSLVGLCLRIALAEQAQAIIRTGKVSFLILDEVLSSLDDERCGAVQRIFEDVQQRGIFEHILMITHLDSVKQGWRATGLEVRKKDTKTSEIIPIAPGAV